MNVLDIFSGIGGFSLGLERAGMRTVAFCEIEPFCRAVLRKHWPHVPIYEDVRTLTSERLSADGIVPDVICGGFPCQDISVASVTKTGLAGDRSGLWREYRRLIGELRPNYAIVENSAALLYRGLGEILTDLAALRFHAWWDCVRASSVGAPFEGDRIYILAAADEVHGQAGMGFRPWDERTVQRACAEYRSTVWLEATGRSARMGHGFSDRLDRRRRTEGVGNAVVPQIPEIIGRAIMSQEQARAA